VVRGARRGGGGVGGDEVCVVGWVGGGERGVIALSEPRSLPHLPQINPVDDLPACQLEMCVFVFV
jgi:hypothetical protein